MIILNSRKTLHKRGQQNHLYESLGFQECGRIPNADKYDDGTYDDKIEMVLRLCEER